MNKKTVDLLKKAQWYKMESYFDGPAKRVMTVDDQDILLQGMIYNADITCGNCGHTIKSRLIRAKSELRSRVTDFKKTFNDRTKNVFLDGDIRQIVKNITTMITEISDLVEDLLRVKHVDDKLELTPVLAVCTVPQSTLEEQGNLLRNMIEANLRTKVLLLTENIHLIKLKPISTATAKHYIERPVSDEKNPIESVETAKIITLEKKEDKEPDREAEQNEGQNVREEDRT